MADDNFYAPGGSPEMGGLTGLGKQFPDLPKPSLEEAAKLPPGTEFLDPSNNRLVVPYRPKRLEDVEVEVPEGAIFIDPQGNKHRRPHYEGVGFTAQALHDMALTDEGREKALRTIYGDKVKRSPLGSLYVEDEGTFLKPDGRGIGGVLGRTASEIAPVGGMTLGTLIGGAAGSVEPGPGTVIGGFGGMVLGAAAGRQVNNVALSIAGIHENLGEQLYSMEREGAYAAGGEVAGKAISKIPAVARAAKSTVNAAGEKVSGLRTGLADVLEGVGVTPERARTFLGTSQETVQHAADITNKGGRVAPSASMPGAPGLKKIEEFHEVFEGRNIFAEAARDYYEQEGRKVVENPSIGAMVEGSLTQAEKRISSERAGQMAIEAARRDAAHDDAVLENSARETKSAASQRLAEGGVDYNETVAKLNADHKAADTSARKLIDLQVEDLQGRINQALEMTKKGEDPSALLRMTAAEFKLYTASTKARAKVMYNAADAAVASIPETSGLIDEADAFMKMMPDSLKGKYPVEIRDLAKLAQKAEGKEPPEPLTWGQLHHLRSWFRHGIDYEDLTPDMREGALKSFEKKINKVLHDPNAPPDLQQAAELLDRADAFYKEKIPFLNDQMVKGVMKSLKSGAGINPVELSDILFDPGRTEAMRKARAIVGENLWKSVQAAHVQKMLNKSKMIDGQIDSQKLAAQIHEDIKNGLISTAYDEAMSKRLTKIAEDVGKVDGSLPITVHEGDTISTLMQRAKIAKEQAEKLAENNPLAALKKEVSTLDKQLTDAQRAMQKARKAAPLNFLYENHLSHMAVRAADKILGSQDLIMAASEMFGKDSNEFNAIRQVYVARFFQRSLGRTATMRGELGGEKGITEEVQALMFPGVTRGQMLQLSRDMEFLFSGAGSDVGGSLAAASRVLNPAQHLPLPKLGGVTGFVMGMPGTKPLARFALGKMFAVVMDAVTHPNFMNWLAGNLKGSEEQRRLARAVLHERMVLGGWFGAVTAQTMAGP